MSGPARLSPQARREIVQALRELDRPDAQQSLRSAFETALRRLGDNPYLGRTAPVYVPAPYRFWSLPRVGYVIVYDPETDPVEILRLVHTRRDLPRVLADLQKPMDESTPG